MRGRSKLTLEQKNQRFKTLLGDENVPDLQDLTRGQFAQLVLEHRDTIEQNLYKINVMNKGDEVFYT